MRKLGYLPVAGKDRIYNYVRENLPESMQEYTSNILTYALSQILPSVEIYPAAMHELFHFRELNLNDVAQFFGEG